VGAALVWALASACALAARADEAPSPPGPRLQIYGYAALNLIYDFDQVNPDWYDMERPTKLPSFPDEFGENGNFWASVRQTRFGARSWLPTGLGEVRTEFEFDLAGVGADAGETTFHLRQAWGSLGPFLAGQTYSVFMDESVFPRSLEYWGPSGMAYYRNIQLRWTPIPGETRLLFAIEQPGAKGDSGEFAERIELQNVQGHFPYPDFTAQYRYGGPWGHVQLGGLLRYIGWTDALEDPYRLAGHVIGWGLNASSVLELTETGRLRLEVTYGEGIETYMRDAPADVGAQKNPGDPVRPVVGKALPVFGMVAFYDFDWTDRLSSAVGYSRIDITNSDGQLPSAFHVGQYALGNVIFRPVPNVVTGLEIQWGRRENFSDGFAVNDFRVQFSAKYHFSIEVPGNR
jgi:hypothetical protein